MRRLKLPLGAAIIDPSGPALTEEDRRRLLHPAVGGVILFAHNYENPQQLAALTAEIEALRDPALPICVDHEGGRVQRFRDGFTLLPAMRKLGRLWDRNREAGREAAAAVGTVMAAELGSHGVDFSFAPVLDLDYGASAVIGDRALHFDPIAAGTLAEALIRSLDASGMAAVGKHFPGHGFAEADSHVAVPVDERKAEDILRKDVAPYKPAIAAGLAGIMPAHVIYPQADGAPAGFSKYWLLDVLRGKLGFDGLVFSDDLAMEAASTAGGLPERAQAAFDAGCDMVLLCQKPKEQDVLLEALGDRVIAEPRRLERMRKRGGRDLRKSVAYREALEVLGNLAVQG